MVRTLSRNLNHQPVLFITIKTNHRLCKLECARAVSGCASRCVAVEAPVLRPGSPRRFSFSRHPRSSDFLWPSIPHPITATNQIKSNDNNNNKNDNNDHHDGNAKKRSEPVRLSDVAILSGAVEFLNFVNWEQAGSSDV